MRRKGRTFNRAYHLGYRTSDPTKDFDYEGRPIDSNYVSIVSVKKCPSIFRDGREYYDPKGVPGIPVVHSRTNMAYGKWRKRRDPRWIENTYVDEYWTCPVYWVEDGRVYHSTARRATEPEAVKRAREKVA